MPAFSYQALDSTGKTSSGVLEGDSARHVRQQLREKSLIPVSVDEVTEAKTRRSSWHGFSTRVSAGELALLTRQLATLIESSLPIDESLAAVAEQCEKPSHRNMVMAVRSKVVEGYELADALADFPSVFDTLYRAMVSAGEKSGHLDVVLLRLADYTEQRQETKSQITQALVYPILMLVFSVAIVMLLLTVVVPKIIGQFDRMGQDLPGITQLLITLSDGAQNYGILIIILTVIAAVGLRLALRRDAFRLKFDQWTLSLPFIGKLSRGINTARFAKTLSILFASAVPLLEAMRISGQVLGNRFIREQVADATVKLREGSTLKLALTQTKVFPPMMLHMIASGEKSGELEGMLDRAAQNQEREFSSLVAISLKVFEPILIVSMAAIVLFIVMAIIQPIMALNNMVNM